MDHCLEFVFRHQLAQCAAVANVDLGETGLAAGNARNAVEHRRLAVAEIVDDEDFMARGHELDHGMRAEIAGAACN